MSARHPSTPRVRTRTRRSTVAAGSVAAVVVALLASVPPARTAGLLGTISAKRAAQAQLRAAVRADAARITATAPGIAAADRRLAASEQSLSTVVGEVTRVTAALRVQRAKLMALEQRLARASEALAGNLRGTYENDPPDLVSVVLASHGFADLLDRVDFLRRARDADAQIVASARTSRVAVVAQASRLAVLDGRDRQLEATASAQRDAIAAEQAALVTVRIKALNDASGKSAQLAALRGQLTTLEAQAARQFSVNNNIQLDFRGQIQAPAGAPNAVAEVIAAGNQINSLPYLWGGGHGSFHSTGYDCSGSVSYALAAAGLVGSPLVSGDFETWGQPGPGRWITVYASAGHVFMVVAGWRFDTVALAQGGTRWSSSSADGSGYVVRHPAGL